MSESLPEFPLAQAAFFHTPEFKLLVECAYYMPEKWAAQRARIAASIGNLNHTTFLQFVRRHRVPVLASTVLTRTAKETDLQPPFLTTLQQWESESRKRNLVLHLELSRLRRQFHEAGIRLFALKGSELSSRLYGDIGMRQMKDIDIMVAPNDLGAALEILEKLGYRTIPKRTARTNSVIRFLCRELAFHHARYQIEIDLHWRFEEIQSPNLEATWWKLARAQEWQSHAELLYLCLHGSKHVWHRLKWLGDVRVLFERMNNNDWPTFLDLAASLGLVEIVAQTLLLLSWLFDFEVNEVARSLIHDNRNFAERSAKHSLLQLQDNSTTSPHMLPLLRWTIRNVMAQIQPIHRFCWHQRARYVLLSLCIRNGDVQSFPLPIYFVWLYPIIRPISFIHRRLLLPIWRKA